MEYAFIYYASDDGVNVDTTSVPKKLSQLCPKTDVYRHILVIDTSISRERDESFFGTEVVVEFTNC